jgi:hypothetical protein
MSKEMEWMVERTAMVGRPMTLMRAHEELVRIRPTEDASLAAWLRYYEHSVALYEQIAHLDPCHDGEALYWAGREQRRVEELTTLIRKERGRH